jgi:hypothetical protein
MSIVLIGGGFLLIILFAVLSPIVVESLKKFSGCLAVSLYFGLFSGVMACIGAFFGYIGNVCFHLGGITEQNIRIGTITGAIYGFLLGILVMVILPTEEEVH